MISIDQMGQRAKVASRVLACATSKQKDEALLAIANALVANADQIIQANEKDLQIAKEQQMSLSMQDRLTLTTERIQNIASSVEHIISLEDPVGKVDTGTKRPNGLMIYKCRVPLGVVGMIYEARPNVTADAAVLCLKSGNACILRGGKEAMYSNRTIAQVMRNAIEKVGLPADCIQLVEDTSRESANEMMRCRYLDVLIPRGGAGLIRAVVEHASVPVIETGSGNCHVYVDESADLQMAVSIVNNAKTSRPSVCNACETLLVHENIAETFLPMVKKALDEHHVQLRGCNATKRILGDTVILATEEDYATEFIDYILAVRVVKNIDEAIAHIQKYSTMHSEAIVTNNYENSQKFLTSVDAAAVYVNASTRFTDGGEFGFGAEIGISTQKLHARGPMGLQELTTCKYVVYGNGQIR